VTLLHNNTDYSYEKAKCFGLSNGAPPEFNTNYLERFELFSLHLIRALIFYLELTLCVVRPANLYFIRVYRPFMKGADSPLETICKRCSFAHAPRRQKKINTILLALNVVIIIST
jgi:hypothetical protein